MALTYEPLTLEDLQYEPSTSTYEPLTLEDLEPPDAGFFSGLAAVDERLKRGVVSGAVGMAGGMLAMPELAERVAGVNTGLGSYLKGYGDSLSRYAASLRPPDAGLLDDLASGLGSALPGIIPGLGAAALAAKVTRLAPLVGATADTLIETAGQAGSVYQQALQSGKSQDEATSLGNKNLWWNLLLLGITNKLGGLYDATAVKGLAGVLEKGYRVALGEGAEEMLQGTVERGVAGEPTSLGQLGYEGLIGGAVGGLMGGGAAAARRTPGLPPPATLAAAPAPPAAPAAPVEPVVQPAPPVPPPAALTPQAAEPDLFEPLVEPAPEYEPITEAELAAEPMPVAPPVVPTPPPPATPVAAPVPPPAPRVTPSTAEVVAPGVPESPLQPPVSPEPVYTPLTPPPSPVDPAKVADQLEAMAREISVGAPGRRIQAPVGDIFRPGEGQWMGDPSTYPAWLAEIADSKAAALAAIRAAQAGRASAGAQRAVAAAEKLSRALDEKVAQGPSILAGDPVQTPQGPGVVRASEPGVVAVKLDDDGTQLFAPETVTPDSGVQFQPQDFLEEAPRGAQAAPEAAPAAGPSPAEVRQPAAVSGPRPRPAPGRGAARPVEVAPPAPGAAPSPAPGRAEVGAPGVAPGPRAPGEAGGAGVGPRGVALRGFGDWRRTQIPGRVGRPEGPVTQIDPATGARRVIWEKPAIDDAAGQAAEEARQARALPGRRFNPTVGGRGSLLDRVALSPEEQAQVGLTPDALEGEPTEGTTVPEVGPPVPARIERTPEGDQFVMPGTERAKTGTAVTPGPIRKGSTKPPLESGRAEPNLFNRETRDQAERDRGQQGTLFRNAGRPTNEPIGAEPGQHTDAEIAAEQARYRERVAEAAPMPGLAVGVVNTNASPLPQKTLRRIARDPDVREIAGIVQTLLHDVQMAVGEVHPEVLQAEMVGVGLDGTYLGANVHREHRADGVAKESILVNIPFLGSIAEFRLMHGVSTEKIAEELASELEETVVHELAHQLEPSHNEAHDDAMARIRALAPSLLADAKARLEVYLEEDHGRAQHAIIALFSTVDAVYFERASIFLEGAGDAATSAPESGAVAPDTGGRPSGGGGPGPDLSVRRGGGGEDLGSAALPDRRPGVSRYTPRVTGALQRVAAEPIQSLKTTLGTRTEWFMGLVGSRKGRAAYNAERRYDVDRDSGEVEISILVGKQLTKPEVWQQLARLPYVGQRGAHKISRFFRSIPVPVIGPAIGRAFGVTLDEQATLADTVEAIHHLDSNGDPVFGTAIYERVRDPKTGVVSVVIDPATGFPEWRWRHYEADGKRLWASLTPQAQAAAKWWAAEREVVKTTYGIVSDVEGYLHHFYTSGILDGFRKIRAKTKVAAPRKFRTEQAGYVRNFELAVEKGLRDLHHEAKWNDFIREFARHVTMPMSGPGPMFSTKPPAGWKEVPRLQLTRAGRPIGQLAGGRMAPQAIIDEFFDVVKTGQQITATAALTRAVVSFVKGNLLTRPATAATNLISGALQYTGKTVEDLWRGSSGFALDLYHNRQPSPDHFKPVLNDMLAMADALRPNTILAMPPELWRAGGNVMQEFRPSEVNVTGTYSAAAESATRAVETFNRVALKHYSAIENYWKRVIAVAEARSLGVAPNAAAIRAHATALDQINDVIDTFAFDYKNVPGGLKRLRGTTTGAFVSLYPTYAYKVSRLYGRYLSAFNPASDLSPQERVVRIASLSTLMFMAYLALRDDDKDKLKRWPGIPYTVDRLGRLSLWTTEDGEELWLKYQKYPWFTLFSALQAGKDVVAGIPSGDLDVILGDGYDEFRSAVGEIASTSPLMEGLDILLEKADKYDRGKTGAQRWAEWLKPLMPFGPTLFEGLKALPGGPQLRPRNAAEVLARVLPLTTPRGQVAVDPVTKAPILLHPTLEQAKFLLGLNVLRINPDVYEIAKQKELVNAFAALGTADNLKSLDRAAARIKAVDPESFKDIADYLAEGRIALDEVNQAVIDELRNEPAPSLRRAPGR